MEIFSVILALCAGNSPGTGEFPAQRPVTRISDGFFDLRLDKRFSKQSRGWWFETPSDSSWRHCNDSIQNSLLPRKYNKYIQCSSNNSFSRQWGLNTCCCVCPLIIYIKQYKLYRCNNGAIVQTIRYSNKKYVHCFKTANYEIAHH